MTELKCQEASPTSSSTYIPCGRPATKSIASPQDKRSYNMCAFCANHSVTNRGMTEDGPATADNPDIQVDQQAMLAQVAATFDYSDYTEEPQGDGDLVMLSNLAEQQKQAQDLVELKQHELKQAQNQLKDIAEHKLPELMDKVGMEKFSTRNGLNIKISEAIRASMGSGVAKERNLDWLEEQGHEAVIKMAVEVPFGKGEEERTAARALAARLRAENIPAQFARKVEPSTLSALIRELLEEGRPVPEEQFGVFRQRIAKIT